MNRAQIKSSMQGAYTIILVTSIVQRYGAACAAVHTAPSVQPTNPSSKAHRTLVPNFGWGAVGHVEEICLS